MSQGRAKEGEDAIAHEAGHGAFIFVDGFDHMLKGAVDDLRPLFGIEVLGGGGGTFDIAEEHGHDAPLADHITAGTRRFQLLHERLGDVVGER